MDGPTSRPQLRPLTSIRFFLALWVVVFHQALPGSYIGSWASSSAGPAFGFLRTGYVAVGVFFVLSGFILSYNYSLSSSWSRQQVARFAIARFARIYPAYGVGLLLVLPFVVHNFLKDTSAANAGKEAVDAGLNWALLQAWIPQAASTWNGPGWSLSAEAFFYCCFPFIGVALWRLSSKRSILGVGLMVWVAALVVPMAVVSAPVPGFGDASAVSVLANADRFWTSLIKFNPLLQLPQFCMGILLGRVFDRLRSKGSVLLGLGYWLYLPGITLELFVIAHADALPYPLLHNGILLPLHGLVILGLALGGGALVRVLSFQPLVFLGNASYSVYILHAVIASWIDTVAKRFFSVQPTGFGAMTLYVLVVVFLSSVLFKAIEEPANRLLKEKLLPLFGGSQRRSIPAVLTEC